MSARADERMWWLLLKMSSQWGFVCCWDEDLVDEFVNAFPEAKKTLIVYLMGNNVSPMLNRAAKRARDLGYIKAGSVGNQDARSFNQRTWCRTWSFTAKGMEALRAKRDELQKSRFAPDLGRYIAEDNLAKIDRYRSQDSTR